MEGVPGRGEKQLSEPSGATWVPPADLAGALADGVCVLSPEGAVLWANQAMADLMDMPLEALVGANGLELIHPEDLARAFDGIDYAQQFPGRTAVAPFRLRRGVDGWLDVEVKTGVLSGVHGQQLTVVIRDATARTAVHEALASVASGQPLSATVDLVGQVVRARWHNTAMAVVLPDAEGGHLVHGVGLSDTLIDHAKGLHREADDPSPWELARTADPVLVVDAVDLPPVVAEAAEAHGFAGFGISPFTDGAGGEGCLIVWFDHVIIARLEFFHAAPEITEVLTIACTRHSLHREMWNAARRDALTGLLNRFGFTEAFEERVRSTRESATDVMATYYIDFDGLKAVNDVHGHSAGDQVLVSLAGCLREVAGDGLPARLGGDEFALAVRFDARTSQADSEALADRLLATMSIDQDPPVSASIGLVVDDGVTEPLMLLERADAAMYRAKEAGKARWSR